MEIFLTSISGILVILGMILVGFVMGEKGWFDDKSRGLIAKMVTQIALPCYMLYTITQRFTAADLLKMLPELRFPALSMVILFGIATAVARIFAVRQDRRGLFISMFFNSNTIFVGLPINQALFGDASIPYVLIYYMCNTTFFWTLGTYLIQRDGEGEAEFDLKTSLNKIFSLPLMGFIIGLIIVKQVFIIQSAMPVMTNAPVVAKLYGADSDYAAIMVTETTLATMIVIPILMVLMA